MNVSDSLNSIYFNLVSNFYIVLNMFFPYYSEEIVSLQYKTIENINESIVFEILIINVLISPSGKTVFEPFPIT